MKLVIIFSTIAVLFSAIICYSYSKMPSEDYEKLADAITAKTAKKLKEEKSLILVGTGGGMMDDIKMMMMDFDCFKVGDIEMARKLLIYCVEEYVAAINANKEIRPYLHEYPFTAKNVEIGIYFRNHDGSDIPPDKTSVAASNEGEIFYYIDDPEKRMLKVIYEETYEEALQAIYSGN